MHHAKVIANFKSIAGGRGAVEPATYELDIITARPGVSQCAKGLEETTKEEMLSEVSFSSLIHRIRNYYTFKTSSGT